MSRRGNTFHRSPGATALRSDPRGRRGGLRGLTHRAVDAEAGLPEGSCSAYMRTRVALLTAAHRVRHLAVRPRHRRPHPAHRAARSHRGYVVEETSRCCAPGSRTPTCCSCGWSSPSRGRASRGRRDPAGAVGPAGARSWSTPWRPPARSTTRSAAGTLLAAIDGVLLRAVREDPQDRAGSCATASSC